MEHRLKDSPWRQSESVESWRKKGGGPAALATPSEDLVSLETVGVAVRRERRRGSEERMMVLMVGRDAVVVVFCK